MLGIFLGLLIFLVTATYLPGAADPAVIPRWAVLLVGIPVLLCWTKPEIGWGHWLGIVFLIYATATLWWALDMPDAVETLLMVFLAAGLFMIGAEVETLTPVWLGLVAGLLLSVPFVLLQKFGWHPVQAASSEPVGLFVNRNFLAEIALVSVVSILTSRCLSFWFALVPALLLVCAPSREVLLAGGVVVLYFLLLRRRWLYLVLCFVLLAAVLVVGTWISSYWISTTTDRLAFWEITLRNLHWFGWGAGQWTAIFPLWEYAHSEPLQLVFDFGIGTVPLAALVIWAWGGNLETERFVLLVLGAESLVAFPLHLPVLLAVFSVVAGHLCGARHPTRRRINRQRSAYWLDFDSTFHAATSAV